MPLKFIIYRQFYGFNAVNEHTLIKFNSFEALLEDFEKNAPHRPALVYESGGKPCFLSREGFAAMAKKKARELSASGKKCLGIVCDGSLSCLVTVFASALAGLQTVLWTKTPRKTFCGARSCRRT